jgi:hypothetical protein
VRFIDYGGDKKRAVIDPVAAPAPAVAAKPASKAEKATAESPA